MPLLGWCLGVAFLSQVVWVSTPTPGQDPQVPTVAPEDGAWIAMAPEVLYPTRNFPKRIFKFPVTITAYSSTRDQTDSTPFITASNTQVRPGIVALSRDLLREFTPGAPFSFGDRVEIVGVGTFTVEDTMNSRYTKRVDIWFSSRHAARRWGRQTGSLAKLSIEAESEGRYTDSVAFFAAALAD